MADSTVQNVRPVLKRTTITVPEELLAEFDDASWAYGYADRSEAVRQAMRIVIPLWRKGRGR